MNPRIEARFVQQRIDALQASHPELSEDMEALALSLESETDLHELLARLVDAEREAKAMEAAISERLASLTKRRDRYKRAKDAHRALMLSLIEHAGVSKVTLPEATISLTRRAPEPRVIDIDALPSVCSRIEKKPDMGAIKNACAAGQMPSGVVMSNGSTSLTIRSK